MWRGVEQVIVSSCQSQGHYRGQCKTECQNHAEGIGQSYDLVKVMANAVRATQDERFTYYARLVAEANFRFLIFS